MPNPFVGISIHSVGALSSALCYTPQKKAKRWSWQTYWLAQASVCWLLLPLIVAIATTPQIVQVLQESPKDAMTKAFLLGFAYGIGGTAFGVAIRYIGFSITYAISIGISAVLGTLLPLILSHQLGSLFRQKGGNWISAGVAVAVLGIAGSGLAGKLRDMDSSHLAQSQPAERRLGPGLLYAVIAGVLSAFFGLALSLGQPIADVAVRHGAGKYQGNIVLLFTCTGAFLSTAVICLFLHLKEGSLREYISFADGPGRSTLAANFGFAALTGVLWYGQFLCYGIAHTFMGKYKFVSWTLHMTMLVLFSALVGLALHEWVHCKRRTLVTLASTLAILLIAVGTIAYGSYIGGP